MKTIIALFSLIIYSTVTFAGDPIPGVDVKRGRKPPGGGRIIESGVTDKNGICEFKNTTTGNYTYYLEYGFKENGIKGVEKNYVIDGIILPKASTSKVPVKAKVITKKVNSKEYGPVVITVSYDDKSIRTTITKGVVWAR